MNVSLAIMEDADGEFSVAYCGRDCTEALCVLDKAIATGKFTRGGVLRSPATIKMRAYTAPEQRVAESAVLPPLDVQPDPETTSDHPPDVPASLAEFGQRKRR